MITHAEAMAGISISEGSISETQATFLAELVAELGPKHIAETGFGRGRSAWAFLAASDNVAVVSFDDDRHAGVFRAKGVIDRYFPGRHELVIGDSATTVPAYGPPDFELVFVDGGHSYETAAADLKNFASPSRVVVIDDLDDAEWTAGVRRAWEEATAKDGPIEHLETITDDSNGHRWAVGRYKEAL